MKKFSFRSGFTLVEIMVVVAIIALLATIAIPNLMRARMSANDALAKATVRAISTAAESYASFNGHNYPVDVNSLTSATPSFLNSNYCTGNTISGYIYACGMASTGYTVTATPVNPGTTGSTTYTITTGGFLTPT